MRAISETREQVEKVGVSPDSKHQVVVNWHLTEACNYKCDFCYAKWDRPRERELIHDGTSTRKLLEQVYELFAPSQIGLTSAAAQLWKPVRLNLAGGEPLLYRKETLAVATFARELGFDMSMITNGSFLDRPLLERLAPTLSLLGISVDSGQESVNLAIGRADKRGGRPLGVDAVEAIFRDAREFNPRLGLKINTVVNALNWQEDMTSVIQRLSPGKWKVLQMLPVQNRNLAISNAQFCEFVKRHDSLADIMSVENNDSMTESYIMIDPLGRFFQNTEGNQGRYHYSRPILEAGAREAFAELTWSESKFDSRYARPRAGKAAGRGTSTSTERSVSFVDPCPPHSFTTADSACDKSSRTAPRTTTHLQPVTHV